MRVLVSAIIAVLVAGCGSADEPAPEPEHATSSPSDSPPPMPRAAKDDTDSGAIAFTKHYVAVLNYAAVTGDTAELKRLSSPQCEGCQEYIDLYEKVYSNGGYYKDGEWTLSDFDFRSGTADDARAISARVRVAPGRRKAGDDDSEVSEKAEEYRLLFKIQVSDSVVLEIERLENS